MIISRDDLRGLLFGLSMRLDIIDALCLRCRRQRHCHHGPYPLLSSTTPNMHDRLGIVVTHMVVIPLLLVVLLIPPATSHVACFGFIPVTGAGAGAAAVCTLSLLQLYAVGGDRSDVVKMAVMARGGGNSASLPEMVDGVTHLSYRQSRSHHRAKGLMEVCRCATHR
uniref:Uncharacterized protein n=1 Tax=Craspedostauros australis TaxID=1486917 RepID=A0A7R9ZPV4_9STRA|mmetsp:Transcript_2386/g.6602  ORF Transcript_2386/g.6602 Transcript_2386/m.6602 type:complete len:167 (+) Transcript_2386:1282-1782(+)